MVVVQKHRGTIHFETEPGKGTTFIVRLPINGTGKQAVMEPAA
jgi:signal transduction histidine kinase